MKEETQVCIIGGGLIGMLCALEAVDAGLTVFLVDKNFSHSGDHAPSVLAQRGAPPEVQPMLRYGHEQWQNLQQRFDGPIGYHQKGIGFLALGEAEQEKMRADLNATQQKTFYQTPESMAQALGVPLVQPELKGLFMEEEGAHIFPSMVHEAVRGELVRKGVRVWGSDRVVELVLADGAITGIKTDHDEIVAEHTVLCAGAWTGNLMAQIGLALPLRPARSHRMAFSVTGEMPSCALVHQLEKGEMIIRPMRSGRVLATYTGLMDQSQATWSRHIDHEMVRQMLSTTKQILPALANGKVVGTQTHILAVTPDLKPYIGRVAAVDGLYVATGMSSQTFAYGAGVAKAIGALLKKQEPEVDLSPFSPDRYLHLHLNEDNFAEQEALIRETFKNMDPKELEYKIEQAAALHEKAKAEAHKFVEGKELKDTRQKVEYMPVDEELK